MSNLDKAIAVALNAHVGQVDKAGQPYILHPLRLMLRFNNEEEMIIAVLHDIVEDSNMSLNDLKNLGFKEQIIEAIDCLSKRDNESYEEFILRVSSNELARKVKVEDLKDNLDLTRIDFISEKDLARVEKYHIALKLLLGKLGKASYAQALSCRLFSSPAI